MPVYVCYRGDCDDLALQQAGRAVFVAHDALGRSWLCVETTLPVISGDVPDSVVEMIVAQGLAQQHGFSLDGTSVSQFVCPDEDALRRELILSTYPEASESIAQMKDAGWGMYTYSSQTGQPTRLTVSNDTEVITVEGRTDNEAWYRAVQWTLGPRPELKGGMPTMTLTVRLVPPPLRTDENGVIRVGNSQVLLDVVIREFKEGASPDAIVRDYPTLDLPDVYAVVAYYLRNRAEVDQYLEARREQAEKLQQEIEAQQPAELRAKLLSRKTQREQEHASPGKR
jgi:uncharacterized protein (DUF433 family)